MVRVGLLMPSFASVTEPAPGIRRVEPASDGTPNRTHSEHHDPAVSRYWASYRHHTASDVDKMRRIRVAAVALMDEVGACTRVCADQAVSMRKIREAIHAAEDAILLDKRVRRRTEPLP